MAVPKIKGIETEWSAIVRGKDNYRPANIKEFILMINAIRKFLNLSVVSERRTIEEIENIERISGDKSLISEVDGDHLWNGYFGQNRKNPASHHGLLPNGSRFYIDAAHIEYSTPECLSAKTLVAADKAGEAILNLARKSVNEILAKQGLEMIIYKDVSDRQGHSYGCHENYSVSRKIFQKITDSTLSKEAGYLISYLGARQFITGAGKMGIEGSGQRIEDSIYQISQRADFIRDILSDCTTDRRAIINLRDEPHADGKRFARLHLIVGDANMSEFATYLKVGITSIILKMLEDGFFEGDIILKELVKGIKLVSLDLTCKKPVMETLGGRKLSSLDMNWEFFERAKQYFSQVCEPSPEEQDLLLKWEETLLDFSEGKEERLRRRLDWKIKQNIFDTFLEAHNIDWRNLKGAEIKEGSIYKKAVSQLLRKDIRYHDINKEKGLYWVHKEAGDVEEILAKEEIIALVKNPPEECRSYFRGKCLEKFYSQIETLNWGEIVFRVREKRGYKNFGIFSCSSEIEMGDPAWGGRKDVGELLDKVDNVEDLLREMRKIKR